MHVHIHTLAYSIYLLLAMFILVFKFEEGVFFPPLFYFCLILFIMY